MKQATIEVLTAGGEREVVRALNAAIPQGHISAPKPVREALLVTAIELRKHVKGLKIRGLLASEASLDEADRSKIEQIVREGGDEG
jgi:hypothetical protein